MKSTYKARWGHDRKGNHSSVSASLQRRREKALRGLVIQRAYYEDQGLRSIVIRIDGEIASLRQRLGLENR